MVRCSHTFDPSTWETELPNVDVDLDEEWECSHPAIDGEEKCIFHLPPDERAAAGYTVADVRERFLDRLTAPEPGAREFVDAHFETLNLENAVLSTAENGEIDLRHCTIDDKLILENAHVQQTLNLYGSRVQRVRMDDAQFEEDVHWYGCDIPGTVHADDTTFQADALFARSRFGSTVRFRNGARFMGGVNFTGAAFTSRLYLTGGRVTGPAYFREVEIDYGEFRQTRFNDTARFGGAVFERNADFTGAQFKGTLYFGDGDPDDDRGPATFHCDGEFVDVELADVADFTEVSVGGGFEFSKATCEELHLVPVPVNEGSVTVSFTGTTVRAGSLAQPTTGTVLYDFQGSLVGDVTIGEEDAAALEPIRFVETEFDGFDFTSYRPALERPPEYTIHKFTHEAAVSEELAPRSREVTYQKAKTGADEMGDNRVAAGFYRKEMRARRERFKQNNRMLDAYQNWLFDVSCRYGESPNRVVMTAGGVIAGFTGVFAGLFSAAGAQPFSSAPVGLNYVLFSLESFTGLVLGGGPEISNWVIRLVAAFEAFSGAFLIALFLFTLTRSIHR